MPTFFSFVENSVIASSLLCPWAILARFSWNLYRSRGGLYEEKLSNAIVATELNICLTSCQIISMLCTHHGDRSTTSMTGYADVKAGARFLAGIGYFTSPPALCPSSCTVCWVEWGDISLGVKRLTREADRSHPSSAMDKNVWRYTSIVTSLCRCALTNHSENFAFLQCLSSFPSGEYRITVS
jgi:hypothetical protein